MDCKDHQDPVARKHVDFAYGKRSVERQKPEQVTRDQKAGHEKDQHRQGEAYDGDDVYNPDQVAPSLRYRSVPAAIEDVVHNDENEQRRAQQFMRKIA
jgi:hypothetical protein